MNLFLHVDYEKVYFRGGLVCNVLCGYRFLERTTFLVLIVRMFKHQSYHSHGALVSWVASFQTRLSQQESTK